MEEKNNSKQVLLSIIGIAVLVIAVVGVSFAFFSYSRTGTSNNVITTGQIYMAFEEANQINLTNQFPTLDEDAVIASTGDTSSMNFTVTGYYSASTGGIDYTIYAIPGDAVGGRTNALKDSEVNVKLTPGTGTTPTNNYAATAVAVGSLTSEADGRKLATGHIAAGTTSEDPQVDSYTLIMYVNDTVRISDTDLNVKFTDAHTETMPVKYCASALVTKNKTVTVNQVETTIPVYDEGCKIYDNNGTLTLLQEDTDLTSFDRTKLLTVYSTLYYSLKLKVVGNE